MFSKQTQMKKKANKAPPFFISAALLWGQRDQQGQQQVMSESASFRWEVRHFSNLSWQPRLPVGSEPWFYAFVLCFLFQALQVTPAFLT